jgi:N-ethylmaleimide reductase
MTRSRAKVDGTPREMAAEYYSQRASVSLIVAEGTQTSEDGQGYLTTPGIYTPAHVAGWKKVTRAVHDKGGRIFIQIMHAGRMSHPDNTPHHRQPVAPSAIAPGAPMFTAAGMQDGAPRDRRAKRRDGSGRLPLRTRALHDCRDRPDLSSCGISTEAA